MFKLSIITLEKIIFEGDVTSLIAPGGDGYLELLTNHAPIITSLQPGKLTVTDKNLKKMIYAVSGGFLEMVKNNASLLADAIEAESEIDIKRAEEAQKRAKELLASNSPDVDALRAKATLRQAENRIKIHHAFKLKTSHSVENL